MILHMNLLKTIEISWRGKFWNRRAVVTVYPADCFGCPVEPQEFEVAEGTRFTFYGQEGGKLAFVFEAMPEDWKDK